MSVRHEPVITERVTETPRLELGKIRDVRARDLAIRFFAGAATSVLAAVLTLTLGDRVGGVFLAFPAILAASLTLIEEEEDGVAAREDARGAVLGGIAMAVFAAVVAIALPSLPGSIALLLATTAWVLVAVGAYAIFWR